MKHLITSLFTLLSLNLTAQTIKPIQPKPEYAILKGHIVNHTEPFCEVGLNGFLSQRLVSIPVDQSGNFSKRVKVDGDAMDISFAQSGRVLFVQTNDTLTFNWDAKDVQHTFKAESKDKGRNNTLRMQARLDSAFLEPYRRMEDSVYDRKLTDLAKFTFINNLYNKEIETLTEHNVNQGSFKIAVDIYFKYAMLMYKLKLLPAYHLQLQHPNAQTNKIYFLTLSSPYAMESEPWFKSSRTYRSFLFDYLRFSNPITSLMVAGTAAESAKRTVPNNFPLTAYNAGLNALHVIEIRDWYATQSIMNSFNYDSFDQTTEVYKDFLTRVKTPYYADTIKQFYQNMQRLKPGMPAPGFTLKDEHGRMVSLNQFKGKTVLIDFWGVNCGPCLYDIKNNLPALHQRYKDKNVVFLNVCVDSNEPEWQAGLKELNLAGTNLVAPGWVKHPMVKSYNVNAIPHYFLIDANGNIANNNSPRPGEQLYTVLDKMVK